VTHRGQRKLWLTLVRGKRKGVKPEKGSNHSSVRFCGFMDSGCRNRCRNTLRGDGGFFLAEEVGNVGPRGRGPGPEVSKEQGAEARGQMSEVGDQKDGERLWSLTDKESFEFCPRISRMTRMGKRQRCVYSCNPCDSWAILGVCGEFARRLARARAAAGDSGAPVWRLERDCVHRTSRSV